MFRLDSPVAKNENIQWKVIDNRAVLLNMDEAVLLQLDEIATQIWLTIDGKKTGSDIIDYIAGNFEVERKHAEKDIRKFLKQLIKSEAIAIGKIKE